MDLCVIPECYVDTNLLETLVPPKSRYNHQKGCGTVVKVMRERFSDDFALGIIDKDKKDVDYLREFDIIHSKGNLFLHKHRIKHHYIIQISPAIERFIMDAVSIVNFQLDKYNLPSTFEELKKVSKSVNSKEDHRFKKLFRDLKKTGVTELSTLANWIEHLKSNRYNLNLDILMGF